MDAARCDVRQLATTNFRRYSISRTINHFANILESIGLIFVSISCDDLRRLSHVLSESVSHRWKSSSFDLFDILLCYVLCTRMYVHNEIQIIHNNV